MANRVLGTHSITGVKKIVAYVKLSVNSVGSALGVSMLTHQPHREDQTDA
jgi:hypothetical protein